MTLHHIVPGLTSRLSAQSLTPAATSGTQTAEEAKEAAVSVDSAHSPAQELNVLRQAEGKQLPETSTAVQTQSNNVAGLQQHIEQITKDSDHLTKENNRLAKENNRLAKENDCLAKDKDRLTKANDRLTNGYNKLEERYNQLKEDNDQISEEIRQFKKQLAIVDEQSNTAETRKLVNHLTTENDQLKEAREATIEQLKAQPIMQDMINKLVKENEESEQKFRNTIAEMKMQNRQLQEQADNLANEVKMLRKENKKLQKQIGKAGQDGPTMDMAKLLKRYYEIEEQFGQMKKDIKQDMKHALAKKEKKIVQQVQEQMTENEKKMQNHVEKQLGETNEYVQKQVEVRLMENEKYLQERLGVNEVKMWAHSQEIQQDIAKHDKQVQDRLGANEVKVQELGQKMQQNLAEHDKQVQDRLGANEVKVQELGQKMQHNIAKHDRHVQESLRAKEAKIRQDVMDIIDERVQKVYKIQTIGETARIVCGDTVNDQGYFTRLMPLEEVPDNVTEISGSYGRFIVYVERKRIEKYQDFKSFIQSVWGLDLRPYYNNFHSTWAADCASIKRIIIIPDFYHHGYHQILHTT